MLAANHGQNRLRGDPFRSSSLMTLIPFVSRPSGRCAVVLTRCLPFSIGPSLPVQSSSVAREHTANRVNRALGGLLPLASEQQIDRARGALYGLAIGDALGMPTQMMSRRQ